MNLATRILTALMIMATLAMVSVVAEADPWEDAPGGVFKPFGEGLPLPWPFPWAKECPMNWEKLAGRYSLEDSAMREEIDLKISIVRRSGYRWVRVARFDQNGQKISDGQVMVERNQKSIRVRLRPLDERERYTWASLKMYYSDDKHLCAEKMLVPILTLEAEEDNQMVQTQYRLIRM